FPPAGRYGAARDQAGSVPGRRVGQGTVLTMVLGSAFRAPRRYARALARSGAHFLGGVAAAGKRLWAHGPSRQTRRAAAGTRSLEWSNPERANAATHERK